MSEKSVVFKQFFDILAYRELKECPQRFSNSIFVKKTPYFHENNFKVK